MRELSKTPEERVSEQRAYLLLGGVRGSMLGLTRRYSPQQGLRRTTDPVNRASFDGYTLRMIYTYTLYRDPNPGEFSEFYQVSLTTEKPFQTQPLKLVERHGWWDDQKKAVNVTTTIFPDESLSLADARLAFEYQITHRAREGFMHVLSRNSPFEAPQYSIIEVKREAR